MRTQLLQARGLIIRERLVRRVFADDEKELTDKQTLTYYGEYEGDKICMGQNERRIDFVVTEVLAAEGYSG